MEFAGRSELPVNATGHEDGQHENGGDIRFQREDVHAEKRCKGASSVDSEGGRREPYVPIEHVSRPNPIQDLKEPCFVVWAESRSDTQKETDQEEPDGDKQPGARVRDAWVSWLAGLRSWPSSPGAALVKAIRRPTFAEPAVPSLSVLATDVEVVVLQLNPAASLRESGSRSYPRS
jgi:hypothetical protein